MKSKDQTLEQSIDEMVEDAIEFGQADYYGKVRGEDERLEAYQKLEDKKQALLALVKTEVGEKNTELLDSLYWMYTQYCGGKWGHSFMGAGETASELLEDAGYIEVDGAGRITKDNGDSQEQRLNEREPS